MKLKFKAKRRKQGQTLCVADVAGMLPQDMQAVLDWLSQTFGPEPQMPREPLGSWHSFIRGNCGWRIANGTLQLESYAGPVDMTIHFEEKADAAAFMLVWG